MLRAISLFSGIGGLDIGFATAGYDIIAQVEIDTFCQSVLKRHASEWWANATIFSDVRQFGIASLPGVKPGDIAAIFGGFPCQDISAAGNGAGIRNGERSGLWYEFARIIGEFRPRTVLLENVSRIASPRKEDGEIQPADALLVIGALSEMGYDARWGIISAADIGAPHLRERWFCMAYDNSQRQLQQKRSIPIIRRRIAHKRKTLANTSGERRQKSSTRNSSSDKERNNPAYKRRRATELHALIASDKTLGNTKSTRLAKRWHRSRKDCRTIKKTSSLPTTARPQRPGNLIRQFAVKPRLGRANDGIPTWLDKPRWPAGQGAFQYDYEQPRTIGKGIDPHRTPRIKALGNAVLPGIAYALACAIKTFAETKDRKG